tara:strand:+ start:701 stop:1000 length:300 start_codon:yes stop_codon:yes gene_type:complete
MPKFYRQNKRRIDPRYFLNETTNRDEEEIIDEGSDCWCVDEEGKKVGNVSDKGKCRGFTQKKCADPEGEKEYALDAAAQNAAKHIKRRAHQAAMAASQR